MVLNLHGIMVANVTPFTPGGRDLDLDWLPAHLRFLDTMRVDALFALGSTGEGPSLALDERKRLVEAIVAHRGRMGVVAGATTPALPDTIRAANDALDAGADAVALLPPYYFADADAAGLLAFFSEVLAALPPQAKVMLYNYPATTQIDIPDEVVMALLDLHGDQLIGMKNTDDDPARAQRLVEIAEGTEFAVLAGSDSHHAEMYAIGCVGGVTGYGNAVPHLASTIRVMHEEGGDAHRAQRHLNRFKDVLRPFPTIGAIKRLIHRTTELPLTHCRPPNRDLTPDECDAFDAAVDAYLRGIDP